MSIDLKPCPFCGREAVLSSIHIGDGDYRAMVTCTRIGLSDCCASVMVERSSRRTAERDAAEKWNTRAERTCHNLAGQGEDGDWGFRCSECGAMPKYWCGEYHIASSGELPDGTRWLGDSWLPWRYCPNCGAKVVEA